MCSDLAGGTQLWTTRGYPSNSMALTEATSVSLHGFPPRGLGLLDAGRVGLTIGERIKKGHHLLMIAFDQGIACRSMGYRVTNTLMKGVN